VADAVISDDSISAWRDPAIVAALVSFLPRTIRFGQHQVTMTFFLSFFFYYLFLVGLVPIDFLKTCLSPTQTPFLFFFHPTRPISFVYFVPDAF
jgi:hypothetical protein